MRSLTGTNRGNGWILEAPDMYLFAAVGLALANAGQMARRLAPSGATSPMRLQQSPGSSLAAVLRLDKTIQLLGRHREADLVVIARLGAAGTKGAQDGR